MRGIWGAANLRGYTRNAHSRAHGAAILIALLIFVFTSFSLSGMGSSVPDGYIPLATLVEDMGLELHWNAVFGRIDLVRASGRITLFLNSQTVLEGSGRADTLPKRIIQVNGEAHLPLEILRFLYRELSFPGEVWVFGEVERERRLTNIAPQTPRDVPVIVQPRVPSTGIDLIVLDAGHGGRDQGAVGHQGMRESTLVLDITKRVERKLKALSGYRVELTRKGNETVSLEKRSEIANGFLAQGHKGIFVSIHANASLATSSRGYETFFLSPIASDAEARRTAAMENGALVADLPPEREGEMEAIFSGMLVEEFRRESVLLAESIQKGLTGQIGRNSPDRGVRKANFYVLRCVYMPSVLVEVGFITNPDEARLLNTDEYREKVADGIVQGIKNFLSAMETSR
jgi:N-acetylmuramoyl-L-alanine amidase